MKFSLSQINVAARKIFTGRSDTGHERLVSPRRDWFIGLAVGAVLMLGIAVWSAYVYVSNRTVEQMEIDTTGPTAPVYRAALVGEALDVFITRDAMFTALRTRQPVPPSSTTTDQTNDAVEPAPTTQNTATTTPNAQPTAGITAPTEPTSAETSDTPTISTTNTAADEEEQFTPVPVQ